MHFVMLYMSSLGFYIVLVAFFFLSQSSGTGSVAAADLQGRHTLNLSSTHCSFHHADFR